ncbi:hypothetical protein GGI15_001860 [Coemansia interrupta]|uniref:Cytidyltransferase-like domain-containing protein n=1 Tax=Coemansia interrupta TaxID=1126814 RepID=A0A9W8LN22_9FUNG|nr:hypothetical protein GGI15_001860 [Coemansia interrupta]
MDFAPRQSLLLHTDLNQPVPQSDIDALRAAVDRTREELTVFMSLKRIQDIEKDSGWSLMQRRLADLYAVAMGRALRNRSRVSVDIIPLDFCAYSTDDMAAFRSNPVLVADNGNELAAEISAAIECTPRPQQRSSSRSELPWISYPHVAVGGTFDHLHVGHKILLTATALAATRRIVCGISADALLENKKHKEFLEPYRKRELNVLLFLRKIRRDIIVELVPISDPYGPTATDSTIEALVVSQETLGGSSALNVRRQENGLAPMELMPVDLITAGDKGDDQDHDDHASVSSGNSILKISSTAIRAEMAERQLQQDRQM